MTANHLIMIIPDFSFAFFVVARIQFGSQVDLFAQIMSLVCPRAQVYTYSTVLLRLIPNNFAVK